MGQAWVVAISTARDTSQMQGAMNAVICIERVNTRKFAQKVQFADTHCLLRHARKRVSAGFVSHTKVE